MIDFQGDVNELIDKNYKKKMEKFLEEFKNYYLRIFNERKKSEMFFVPAIKSLLFSKLGRIGKDGCDSLLVAPDGHYYSCGRFLGLNKRQLLNFSFGNIENGLEREKRLAFLREKRKKAQKVFKKCKQCDFLSHCLCKIATFAYYEAKGGGAKAGLKTFCLYNNLFCRAMLNIGEILYRRKNEDFLRIYEI
jgi:radical SAM protein with 4Fe4S-binding SPASM domain